MYTIAQQLLDTAQQRQAGEIDGVGTLAALIFTGTLLTSVEETLNEWQPAADQVALQGTLTAHLEALKSVISRWFNDEITSAEVPELVQPVQASVETSMKDIAESAKADGLPADVLNTMLEEIASAFEEMGQSPEAPGEQPGGTAVAGSSLEILSHQSYTEGDWFHIVGEVRNNSSVPMEYVKIVATLYDQDGKVVGTDFAYTDLDVIPPGGKAPFSTGTDEWTGTATYKLQVQGSEGELPRQDLEILSHESYVDSDWLHVRGEVKNTGQTPAEYVKVVITLYDADGGVVGMDFTYTDLDTIPPGETAPFESGTDHWPGFDHYEIQVQGQ